MLPDRRYTVLASGPDIQSSRMEFDADTSYGGGVKGSGSRTGGESLEGKSLQKQTFLMAGEGDWPSTPVPPEVKKGNLKLKKRIRIMRIVHRIALTILAISATALESQTLYTFLTTRNTQRSGRGPWAKETSLWPSILLLSTSAVTAFIGLAVLLSYVRSIKTANTLAWINAIIIITVEVVGFVTWIVVAVLYRTGRTGKDLWGWACSPVALQIQPNFEGVVNFDGVCKKGQTNWGLSIASAATNVFSLLVWYFAWRRRHLQKLEERILKEENERNERSERIEAVRGGL